jgi:hypothetical protein
MTERLYNLNDIFKSLSKIILTISSDVKTISEGMGITTAADLTLHNDLVELNNKISLLDINNQSMGLTLHKDLTGLNTSITLLDANNQSMGLTLHSDLTGLNSNVSLLNNTVYLMDINSQNTGLTLHKDLTGLNSNVSILNNTVYLMDINSQNTGLTLHADLTGLNNTFTLMDINNQSMGLTLHTDLTTLNSNITLMDINSQNTGLTLHKALTTLNSNITLMDINNQSTGLTLHKALTGINTSITLMDINNQSTGLTLHKALTGINTAITLMDINNQSIGLTLHADLTGLNTSLNNIANSSVFNKSIYHQMAGTTTNTAKILLTPVTGTDYTQATFSPVITAQKFGLIADAGFTGRTVSIYGLDENYNYISESLSTAGSSVVSTVKSYVTINDIKLMSGTYGASAIYIKSVINNTLTSGIHYGFANATNYANPIFICPKSKKATLTSITNYYTQAVTDLVLCVYENKSTTYNPVYKLWQVPTTPGSMTFSDGAIQITEGQLAVWFRVSTTSTTTQISAAWLIEPA